MSVAYPKMSANNTDAYGDNNNKSRDFYADHTGKSDKNAGNDVEVLPSVTA